MNIHLSGSRADVSEFLNKRHVPLECDRSTTASLVMTLKDPTDRRPLALSVRLVRPEEMDKLHPQIELFGSKNNLTASQIRGRKADWMILDSDEITDVTRKMQAMVDELERRGLMA